MKKSYIIAVIDGQGGGIGKTLTAKLREAIPEAHIRALGTNSTATNQMIKAGADDGATGENAIICNVQKADLVMGVLAILSPNSLLGELSPAMATAIGESDARKILIPVERCNLRVPFAGGHSLQQNIDEAVKMAKDYLMEITEENA